jgi:hypothetical protein
VARYYTPKLDTYWKWTEQAGTAYFYWPLQGHASGSGLSRWSWAFLAEYQQEKFSRPPENTGFEGIVSLDTQYVPLGVSLFPGASTSIQLMSTYVRQHGVQQIDVNTNAFGVSSSFWVTDLNVAYRFPTFRGRFSVGVSNLFDRQFSFVDSDPISPRFAHGRLAYARLTLNF